MNWLNTFTLLMRSQIATLREKVEDPERVLHQLILDMEEELELARSFMVEAIGDEIQLGKEVEKLRAAVDRCMNESASRLKSGDEAGARSALQQKQTVEERLGMLVAVYETQREQTRKLQEAFRDLEDKILQARHKQRLLLARMVRAETAEQISRALEFTTGPSAAAQFHQLEQQVEQAESLCQAFERLEARDAKTEERKRLAEQERKEQLEREFEELKRRVETDEA